MFSLNVDLYQLTLNITIRMQTQHIWTRMFLALWTLPWISALSPYQRILHERLCWWIQRRNLFRNWGVFFFTSFTSLYWFHIVTCYDISFLLRFWQDATSDIMDMNAGISAARFVNNHETVITWQDSVKMGVKEVGRETIV